MGVPQTGWYIREEPIQMDPRLWKPPYDPWACENMTNTTEQARTVHKKNWDRKPWQMAPNTNPIKNHKSSKSSNRWCSIHGMTTVDLSKFIVKHWLNHPQKLAKRSPMDSLAWGQLKEGQGQGVVLETRSSWSAAAAAEDEPKKRVSNGGTPKMVGLFCGKSHSRNGW